MNEIGHFVRSAALAGAIGLALAGQAFAHAHLATATPSAQATLAKAPTQLTLTFSEGVNLAFTGAAVTGPDGKAVTTARRS